MVQAWYMEDVSGGEEQYLPQKLEPNQDVSLAQLDELGVKYYEIDVDSYNGEFEPLKKEFGYTYDDTVDIHPSRFPNFDNMMKTFFSEHLHTDDEIRLILNGSGYFDVRDKNDKWIRIYSEKKDLIVLPAGMYHRFTLDSKKYIKAMRLFKGVPVWTAHTRPYDDLECRKEYLKSIGLEA
ncbi:1,2-dihydroxy-3-keto-5-methylthiopentene dioxygenase isoform X1 [Octopus sinensis]|uniref:Acireductone dioxygenase n=1 Tax=Octopus sinensis TaxID=2607531 RepID=A0A6P7TIQ9_9MOLL|nr:1,2-dihydroxy-3-keto-5-methylthiopentene dioxygenase isoform X1 [Octopus sinensis]